MARQQARRKQHPPRLPVSTPSPFPGDTYFVEVCKPKTNRFSSHHPRPADTDGPPRQRRRLLRSGRRRPDLRRQQVRHLLQPGGQVQLQHDLVPGYLGLPGRLWVVRLIWSGCVSGWWEGRGVRGVEEKLAVDTAGCCVVVVVVVAAVAVSRLCTYRRTWFPQGHSWGVISHVCLIDQVSFRGPVWPTSETA